MKCGAVWRHYSSGSAGSRTLGSRIAISFLRNFVENGHEFDARRRFKFRRGGPRAVRLRRGAGVDGAEEERPRARTTAARREDDTEVDEEETWRRSSRHDSGACAASAGCRRASKRCSTEASPISFESESRVKGGTQDARNAAPNLALRRRRAQLLRGGARAHSRTAPRRPRPDRSRSHADSRHTSARSRVGIAAAATRRASTGRDARFVLGSQLGLVSSRRFGLLRVSKRTRACVPWLSGTLSIVLDRHSSTKTQRSLRRRSRPRHRDALRAPLLCELCVGTVGTVDLRVRRNQSRRHTASRENHAAGDGARAAASRRVWSQRPCLVIVVAVPESPAQPRNSRVSAAALCYERTASLGQPRLYGCDARLRRHRPFALCRHSSSQRPRVRAASRVQVSERLVKAFDGYPDARARRCAATEKYRNTFQDDEPSHSPRSRPSRAARRSTAAPSATAVRCQRSRPPTAAQRAASPIAPTRPSSPGSSSSPHSPRAGRCSRARLSAAEGNDVNAASESDECAEAPRAAAAPDEKNAYSSISTATQKPLGRFGGRSGRAQHVNIICSRRIIVSKIP